MSILNIFDDGVYICTCEGISLDDEKKIADINCNQQGMKNCYGDIIGNISNAPICVLEKMIELQNNAGYKKINLNWLSGDF